MKGGLIHAHHDTPPKVLELGRVVVTSPCLERLRVGDEDDLAVMARDLDPLLRRHVAGDWGDVQDPEVNESAFADGTRVLSVYTVRTNVVWVITDGTSDACPACWAGIGECEADAGEWHAGIHFRTDLPPRRLATTVMLPEDY